MYCLKRLHKRRHEALPVLALLLSALALRLINFTGVVDWDTIEYVYEALALMNGEASFVPDPRSSLFRIALLMPLSLSLKVFGPSEASVVIYPLLTSVLAILALYCIGRLLSNEASGLIAAGIWAVFPLNVFTSTLFGPDQLLANFTIFAFLCMILSERKTGWESVAATLLSLAFSTAGVFVKPSGIFFTMFLSIYSIAKLVKRSRVWIAASLKTRQHVLLSLAVAVSLLCHWYLQKQNPTLILLDLFQTSTDLSSLLVLGNTQEVYDVPVYTTSLFFIASPLFIIAFAGLGFRLNKSTIVLFVWSIVLFGLFEWASISTNPIYYKPIVALTKDRNVLFIFVPFVILCGVFFSKYITAKSARIVVTLSSLAVPILAQALERSNYIGLPLKILGFFVAITFCGLLLFPLIITRLPKYQNAVSSGLLICTFIAFLHPAPPMHISYAYWQLQSRYRVASKGAADFFLNHENYPVFALGSRNSRELDWASHLKLGYEAQEARIRTISSPSEMVESGYLYLRDEINQYSPVPSNWWKVYEVNEGLPRPMLVYRILTDPDAQRELELALSALEEVGEKPSTWHRLLGAATNARDATNVLWASQRLIQLDPVNYNASIALSIVKDAYLKNELQLGSNMLDTFNNTHYESNPNQNLSFQIDEKEGTITFQQGPNISVRVNTTLELEPLSYYVVDITVKSSSGIDLIVPTEQLLSDSHEYQAVYGDFERVIVVFFSADFKYEGPSKISIIETQDAGETTIKDIGLYQILNIPQWN